MKVAVNLGRRTGSGHCPSYLGEDCVEHSQDVTFGLGPYYVSMKGYVDIRFRDKPFVPYELALLFAPETDGAHALIWEHNLETVPEFAQLRFMKGDFCPKERKASKKYLPNTKLGSCENHAVQIVKRKCSDLSLKKKKLKFYLNELDAMLNMTKVELKVKFKAISNGAAEWDPRMVSWWNHPNSELRPAVLQEMNKESLIEAGFRPGYRRVKVSNNPHEGGNNGMQWVIRELTGLYHKGNILPHKFVRATHTWAHSIYNRMKATLREDYLLDEFGGPSDPKWIIPAGGADEGISYDQVHMDTRTWAEARADFVSHYEKASIHLCAA